MDAANRSRRRIKSKQPYPIFSQPGKTSTMSKLECIPVRNIVPNHPSCPGRQCQGVPLPSKRHTRQNVVHKEKGAKHA